MSLPQSLFGPVEPAPPANCPTPEDRMRRLLELTAEEIRPCRECQATLYMVRHRNGKIAPYTVDGLNHFLDCPFANNFRRTK